MNPAGLVYHPDYLKHDTGNHPERPERLETALSMLQHSGLLDKLVAVSPRTSTEEELLAVHSPSLIAAVRRFAERGGGSWGVDTTGSHETFDVALLAAGGVMSAVDAAFMGIGNVFAMVRPPGHHATSYEAMGFCFFNNVAVSARYALKKYGIKRILIVDWDVHHGNGTESIFYEDPSVLYLSTHQEWIYPGTGSVQDVGRGPGEGFNINIPLPAGTGDSDFKYIFQEVVLPVAHEFKPELILVSAGFDAHFNDILGGLGLTASGFAAMAGMLKGLEFNGEPVKLVLALEGGYHLESVGYSILAVMNVLAGTGLEIREPYSLPQDAIRESTIARVREVKRIQSRYWPVLKD